MLTALEICFSKIYVQKEKDGTNKMKNIFQQTKIFLAFLNIYFLII